MPKMHADEVDTDAALVRRLLADQFPDYADRRITRVEHPGTDNAIYRLGDDLCARLPRSGSASIQPAREHRWLPVLAPHLPLAIPVPLALGEPAHGYPHRWTICPWLPGHNATPDRLDDLTQTARDLAAFIVALRAIDATGAPAPGPTGRGLPLATRDSYVRDAIARLQGQDGVDADAITHAWDAALAAPVHDGPSVWIHGDLQSGNILTVDGSLSAVIDWGCMAAGDPAAELRVAWSLFSGESRAAFRAALNVDNATWARARGWALSSVIGLPYYRHTNPAIIATSRHTIAEALAHA